MGFARIVSFAAPVAGIWHEGDKAFTIRSQYQNETFGSVYLHGQKGQNPRYITRLLRQTYNKMSATTLN